MQTMTLQSIKLLKEKMPSDKATIRFEFLVGGLIYRCHSCNIDTMDPVAVSNALIKLSNCILNDAEKLELNEQI